MKQLVLPTLGLLGVAGAAQGQALRGGYTRSYFIGRTSYWFGPGHFRAIRRGCTDYQPMSRAEATCFQREYRRLLARH